MKKIAILFIAVLLTSPSWAYEIAPLCCDTGEPWIDTDWTQPGECCNIPAAPDLSPDILIGATLYVTVKNEQDVGIENTSTSSTADVYVVTTLNFFINGLDLVNQQVSIQEYFPGPTAANTQALAVYDGTIDYTGVSGMEWLDRQSTNTWSKSYSGADLAYFQTQQQMCAWTNSGFGVIGAGSSNIDAYIDTQAFAEFCIVYEYDEYVPVTLSSFTATYFDGSPILQWTTQSETDNIGWNIYRADSEEFEWSMQINNDLIPGAGTSSEPTDYIFEDEYVVYPSLSYWYWIEDISADGNTNIHGPVFMTIPEDAEDPGSPEIFNEARLYNSPNPFNPITTILFDIDIEGAPSGELLIYDIKGNLVRKLHEGIIPQSGITWDSTNEFVRKVPSGIYLYVLRTDQKTYAKKMVLTK
jgi:hypothetical protein